MRGLYVAGVESDYLHVVPNEVTVNDFSFSENPKHHDKSICLGAVSKCKRQYAIAGIANIDFVGPVHEKEDFLTGAHQGEWSREQVCCNLTDYANKILLSEAEAHNLACLEAMAAGLGLVISEAVTDNLDISLPFINVVPENKIHDREFVSAAVVENRATALAMRKEIREYVKRNFDTERIVKAKYLPLLSSIVE